tara:strand:- start:1522 stop:2544 length:1023 start_codon:yes stop_codon:yes gene_type:complete
VVAKKRVFSGVQPTGSLHLGNWLGAIKNWVDLQSSYETFFCVVDLHALTINHDPKELKENTLSTAALYIACGIDPQISSVFVQSHIPAHSELCWLLNCFTPMNWLERMIQFKEKSIKQGENVSIGLFDYPILMAADILLYSTDLVPVGEDQKQHLELARNIAQQRINSIYSKTKEPIFKVPEPLIIKEGAKIMSLIDGRKKMSKSDPNDGSRICLLDSPETIVKKIKKAKTDQIIGLEFGNIERPESDNLLSIYSILSGLGKESTAKEFENSGWGRFKPELTELIISSLKPIQSKYAELSKDYGEIKNILNKGAEKAENLACKSLEKLHRAIGIQRREYD